jgi:hypothetical protein
MSTTVPASGAISTSGLPYTFNPPLHPSLQHIHPQVGLAAGSSIDNTLKQIYDEFSNTYGAGTDFKSLRLGRIIMGKDVMSFAMKQAGTRYGFRFLYNPNQISGALAVGTNIIADPTNSVTAVLQEGLENINFEVWLNRVPEVMGKPPLSDYHPTMSVTDMNAIRERGTQYDVEFLYRVANGVHNTTVRSGTGDIGILLPNPCELYIGPLKSRGALMSVSTTDILYSPDMVPMLTRLTITFNRFLTIANTEEANRGGAGSPESVAVPVMRLQTSSTVTSLTDMFKESLFGAGWAAVANWITGGDDNATPAGGGGTTPAGGSGWTLAPSLKKLGDDAKANYSQVSAIRTYRNEQGSGHNKVGSGSESLGTTGSVHAIDIMINVSKQSMDLLNRLLTKCRAGDTRLAYLIHDRRIWSKNHGPWAERPYTGPGTAHTDHIHVSLNGDTTAIGIKNENNLSSWGI